MYDENISQRKSIEIALLGDHIAGKSSICSRLLSNEFYENIDTTFTSIKLKTIFFLNTEIEIDVYLWDTDCRKNYRSSLYESIKNVGGLILVFDVSDYNSFKNLKKWLKDISQNLEKNIPLV